MPGVALFPVPVAAIRARAIRGAERHRDRSERQLRRATRWLERRDSYMDALQTLPLRDPMALRATMLAEHAGWRALAWTMLSEHETARAVDAWRKAAAVWRDIKARTKA